MSKLVSILIEGDPVPKERPRFSKSGNAYTPGRTRCYEQLVGLMARRAIDNGPLRGAVRVRMEFYRSNFRRVDLDNLMKAVLDGVTGIVFFDDAQVVEVAAIKHLGVSDPHTLVSIETVEEAGKNG